MFLWPSRNPNFHKTWAYSGQGKCELLTKIYFQVIVNFHKPLVRLGLLHLIATNICDWAMTVSLEATEAFVHAMHLTNLKDHKESGTAAGQHHNNYTQSDHHSAVNGKFLIIVALYLYGVFTWHFGGANQAKQILALYKMPSVFTFYLPIS